MVGTFEIRNIVSFLFSRTNKKKVEI